MRGNRNRTILSKKFIPTENELKFYIASASYTIVAKKLCKGRDRLVAGVCSGIAERYDSDPTAIRILWALLTIFTAVVPGVIAYLVCWAVMPKPR